MSRSRIMTALELATFAAKYPNAMVRSTIGDQSFREHAICSWRTMNKSISIERIPAPVQHDGTCCAVCGGDLPGEAKTEAVAMWNELPEPVVVRNIAAAIHLDPLPPSGWSVGSLKSWGNCPATYRKN